MKILRISIPHVLAVSFRGTVNYKGIQSPVVLKTTDSEVVGSLLGVVEILKRKLRELSTASYDESPLSMVCAIDDGNLPSVRFCLAEARKLLAYRISEAGDKGISMAGRLLRSKGIGASLKNVSVGLAVSEKKLPMSVSSLLSGIELIRDPAVVRRLASAAA